MAVYIEKFRFFIVILTAMLASQISLFGGKKRLYYDFPISAFARVEVSSEENHPDYAGAECRDDKLYAKSKRTYGTAGDEIAQDLVTGELSGSGFYAGPDSLENFVIRPPDRGGDYFWYMDKLTVMEGIFHFTRSVEAEAYIGRVRGLVKKMPVADAVRCNIYSGDLLPGAKNKLLIEHKVKRKSDVMIRLVDKEGKVWLETKFPVAAAGENSRKLQLVIPENTPRGTGYKLVARVIPRGGSWDDSLAEATCDEWGRGMTVR